MLNNRKPCAMRGRMPLKQERSEYGKLIRKEYEGGGEIKAPRANVQQFEIRKDGICNTITTVMKDTLTIGRWTMDNKRMIDDYTMTDETGQRISLPELAEIRENEDTNNAKVEDYLYKDYGVFKLSVTECSRLQGNMDRDTKKMLEVNSKSQCYKQIGNAIAVPVLMALFSQLNIKGVPVWNDIPEEQRQALADSVRDW